jgi:hypothetical protein
MSGLGDKTAFPTLGDDYMDTPDRGRQPKSAYGMDGDKGMTFREYLFAKLLAAFAAGGNHSTVDGIGAALAWTRDGIAALEDEKAPARRLEAAAYALRDAGWTVTPPDVAAASEWLDRRESEAGR